MGARLGGMAGLGGLRLGTGGEDDGRDTRAGCGGARGDADMAVPCGGAGAGFARDGGGLGGSGRAGRQQSGLPELDEVFQAGDEAGQGGQNQGVQGRDHPGLSRLMAGFGTDGGGDRASLCGQRGG